MEKKHIVFTHTDFRLYWRPRLVALKKKFDQLGWNLKVIEIAGKGSPYYFAPNHIDPESDWWSVLFPSDKMEDIRPDVASKRLFKTLEQENPDIVVASAIAFPSGATAVRWAHENKRRVIIFDDARQCDVVRNKIINFVKRRIYDNVDAVIVPAPTHSKDYIDFGFQKSQIFYGVDVVDNKYFSSHTQKPAFYYRNKPNHLVLPNRFLLGVGRQIPIKNWGGLLIAWHKFCHLRPHSDLSLLLVGQGPDRAILEQTVSDENIKRVFFHDFATPETLTSQYYSNASALILPSFNETWGLVVNEAMASGLPVLVSRHCGCCETLVKHEANGWYFNPRNTDEIARCIDSLDSLAPGQQRNMGKRSMDIIQEWDLDRFVDGVIDSIDFVSKRSHHQPSLFDKLILKSWKGRYRPT